MTATVAVAVMATVMVAMETRTTAVAAMVSAMALMKKIRLK